MNIDNHPVVPREEWLQAREALLRKEKAFTHERDRLSAERRALPWVRIDTPYAFDGPDGRESLADLFDGRGTLVIYHFMFGPGWEEGCPGCSFLADHIDGANQHLKHHDVTLLCVSRAPLQEFQAFRKRMGWNFKWVSSHGNSFNYDFGVAAKPEDIAAGTARYNYGTSNDPGEDMPGLSVFYRNPAGEIFHTYSTYARGLDLLVGAYNFLDLLPKGRDEQEIMDWMRHHDRYEDEPGKVASCCKE